MIGSGFSPSDIACTKEYMMSLKNYKAVLEVNGYYSQLSRKRTASRAVRLPELFP